MAQFRLREFFFPSLTPRFLIRVAAVALVAYLFFGHLLIPMFIRGRSMEPTYHDGGFTFCWRGSYLFHPPRRGDIVAVKLAGEKVMLLKRVVALEGEEVEFRNGVLFVDGKPLDEPYVKNRFAWDLPPRKIEPGCVYLVGDNRGMPIEEHDFGQTPISRIAGKPIW